MDELAPLQDVITGAVGQAHPLVLEGNLPLAAWPYPERPPIKRIFGGICQYYPSVMAEFRVLIL